MGLNPQVFGKEIPHGFAGSYARQPDMIVNTRPAGGAIPFGLAMTYYHDKSVVVFGNATTNTFLGVAGKEIKSALTYLDQSQGQYAPGEPVSVFQRGAINVKCQRGTPALGGAVYVRITANGSFSTAAVGGFEAEDDSGKVVQLTNCQWAGPADANGVAELRILTMNNA